jgi:hypothetical protein
MYTTRIPREFRAPVDMTDYAIPMTDASGTKILGHGTCVSSVATGQSVGVASNSQLIVIKYKNGIKSKSSFILEETVTPGQVAWAWREALSRALSSKRGGNPMKAVINFSAGNIHWFFLFILRENETAFVGKVTN